VVQGSGLEGGSAVGGGGWMGVDGGWMGVDGGWMGVDTRLPYLTWILPFFASSNCSVLYIESAIIQHIRPMIA
jgi:hypothetical protein